MAMMRIVNKKLETRFVFYWDGDSKRLFIMELAKKPEAAVPLADGIETPEAARLAVACWCGGYVAKERERWMSVPQHHRILAETGFHPLFGGTLGNA